ncbi:MAG: MBL fold metallo-hydrolase [Proteobacteria bacterium]|nr:MBL fold metallo-hydrolase [Candidatus Enterousia scatequi]
MENAQTSFEIFRMQPQNTNSVLLCRGNDCVIFDAWGRATDWAHLLDARGLNLRAIYSTHGHPDHISAAPDLAKQYGAIWYLHPADRNLIGWGNEILDMFGLDHLCPHHDVSSDLVPGNVKVLPETDMQIIETPGHSAGGVVYWFPEYKILLSGDTIFRDGFGRYDLPGGSRGDLEQSISKIYDMNLPDDTYVVHGHGLDSTIKILRETNTVFKHYD